MQRVPTTTAALLWALVVALALLTPSSSETALPSWLPPLVEAALDKIVHGLLFFVQAALLGRALVDRALPVVTRWTATVVATVYGGALELLQAGIDGRGLEGADAAANALGAISWLALVILRARRA